MTVFDGMFNSVNKDRFYNADVFRSLFKGMLEGGVFEFDGDGLRVSANDNMTVSIGTGKAWFNELWVMNDFELILEISTSHPTLTRIDAVVVDFNNNVEVRRNDIFIVEGEYAIDPLTPTMVNDELHNQYPLAYITVGGDVSLIETANISNRVGTPECPFATGILSSDSLDVRIELWTEQFNTWFNGMVDFLDDDCATANLQSQINDILPIPMSGRNLLDNSAMNVAQRERQQSFENIDGFPGPDRFRVEANGVGFFGVEEPTRSYGGVDRNWLKLECGQGSDVMGQSPSDMLAISQRIENNQFISLSKGSEDAKQMSLSFLVYTNMPGTYVVEINDLENDRRVSIPYDIPTTNTFTEVSLSIPADFVGSIPFTTSHNVEVRFWIIAGSDYDTVDINTGWGNYVPGDQRTAGVRDVTVAGDQFSITEIQLEISDEPSKHEHISYADELLECMRYYHLDDVYSTGYMYDEDMIFVPSGRYVVEQINMGYNPTVAIDVATAYIDGSGNVALNGVGLQNQTRNAFTIYGFISGLLAGHSYSVHMEYRVDYNL